MGVLDRFRQQKPPKPDVAPRSAPGRAHTNGFIDYDEVNADLIGHQGLRIFDRMYRTDGDVRQVVAMVCNPISAGTWEIIPYGGQDADQQAQDQAEIVKWALFEAMSPNLVGHIAEMLPLLIRSGFAPYEQIWTSMDYKGKTYIVPRKLDVRLPRTIWRWFQNQYGELSSIVQTLPVPLDSLVAKGFPASVAGPRKASNGETLHAGEVEIMAQDLIYYRVGAEGDNWEGQSLLRPAYKHWIMKDAIERIDAIAQEREAVGIPICYPPTGATPAQLDAMELVLAAMRTNDQGYIVAPGPKAGSGAPEGQGWLIEVLGYDRTGSGRDPQPSLAYHTQKIAAAFIAEFMRLGHGQSGARATAQVQADPFLLSVESLSHLVEGVLNEQLIKPFCAYNFPKMDNPPKLQLSLIDSTSLTQLADFVLKLTQVGAMLPDQELEDFLRARADLPPADPKAVKKRGDDEKIRRDIVSGGGQMGDGFGGSGGAAQGKPATPKGSGSPKAKPSSKAAKQMSRREQRDGEMICDIDGIENWLNEQPSTFTDALQSHIIQMAQGGKAKELRDGLHTLLAGCYDHGARMMEGEVSTLTSGYRGLAVSPRDGGAAGLKDRADHGADLIESRMRLAAKAVRLNHGDDPTAIQMAAEREGFTALKHVAWDHGTGAFMQGRHDQLVTLAASRSDIGSLYSAILDDRTCSHCADADDGVVRRFDDPVRLDRRPPNRHCESTASGHNYCRCMEIPALMDS